jgi:hypothetical protein
MGGCNDKYQVCLNTTDTRVPYNVVFPSSQNLLTDIDIKSAETSFLIQEIIITTAELTTELQTTQSELTTTTDIQTTSSLQSETTTNSTTMISTTSSPILSNVEPLNSKKSNSSLIGIIIGIVITSIILLILGLIFFIFFQRRRRNQNEKKNVKPSSFNEITLTESNPFSHFSESLLSSSTSSSNLLNNELEIIGPVGKGNFGEVMKGKLGHFYVACKKLKEGSVVNTSEMKILSSLKHPNIVTFIGIKSHNGTNYLVVEYMNGGDLLNYVRTHECEEEKLLKAAYHISLGMEYLENKNYPQVKINK